MSMTNGMIAGGTGTSLAAELAVLTEKLFYGGPGCMRFSFGYLDSTMTRIDALAAAGTVIPPGGEKCVPVPTAWSIDEPLEQLISESPGLIKLLTQPFFSSGFKLFTKAVPCAYFFGGQEQVEAEFSRDVAKGSNVRDFLIALHGIFVDAKCHPCETMLIFGLQMKDDGVYVEWGR